jgi:signal transduction histidine kinase
VKRRARLAAAFAVAGLAIAAVPAVSHGTIDGRWWAFALLTLGAIGGALLEVRVGPGAYISATFVFSVIAAAFLGPLAALLTPTVAAALAGLVHRARPLAILGNCTGSALPNVLAAIMLDAWLPGDRTSWGTPVAIVAVSALVWLMNVAFVSVFFGLLDGMRGVAWARPFLGVLPAAWLTSCVFAGAVGGVYAESPAAGIAFAFALTALLHYVSRQSADAIERAHRIGELAESRRALAADAAQAEERERRRIAERLHDDALQSLLSARQDIRSVARGDSARLQAAETAIEAAVAELRDTVAQLHPAPTAAAGIAPILRAVADAEARRAGFAVDVSTAPGVEGPHDRLLLGVGRELLINVGRHADAEHVRVTATADDGFVVLEICDDGRGMSREERERALAAGHLGLASMADRVEALGGSLTIASPTENGRGTTVTVQLPR